MRAGLPVWERIPGSRPGSKWRNLFSYNIICLTLILLAEQVAAGAGQPWLTEAWVGFVLIAIAVVYFLVVVVGVIFLTSGAFRLEPSRLARDTVISIVYVIFAFALFYRNAGISLEPVCEGDFLSAFRPSDAIYFSAVTFSTLGYGDFRPCPDAHIRLTAAFHAIFGNLHLGLIVGAAFFFAQDARPAGSTSIRKSDVRGSRRWPRSARRWSHRRPRRRPGP